MITVNWIGDLGLITDFPTLCACNASAYPSFVTADKRNLRNSISLFEYPRDKAADPDVKWGAKPWYLDHPKRQKHIQGLYNAGEFHLVNRAAGGVMIKGMTAVALMAEANAAGPDAKLVKNAESVRRWLREGAKGLSYEVDLNQE